MIYRHYGVKWFILTGIFIMMLQDIRTQSKRINKRNRVAVDERKLIERSRIRDTTFNYITSHDSFQVRTATQDFHLV